MKYEFIDGSKRLQLIQFTIKPLIAVLVILGIYLLIIARSAEMINENLLTIIFYVSELLVIAVWIFKGVRKAKETLQLPRIAFNKEEILYLDDKAQETKKSAKIEDVKAIFIDTKDNFVYIDSDEEYMKLKEAYKKGQGMIVPNYAAEAKVVGETDYFDEAMPTAEMLRSLENHTLATNRRKVQQYLVEKGWHKETIPGSMINIHMFTRANKYKAENPE